MAFVSLIIPVHNKIEITLKCIEHVRHTNHDGSYEIIIVDNASIDETRARIEEDTRIKYIRNERNVGLSHAYNRAVNDAVGDIYCFMHNDVFIYREDWMGELSRFISGTPDAGIVGLYGAKTLRRDGTFRGKTIVHAIKDSPRMRKPYERVAVVDGLLLTVRKDLFNVIGGFSEEFPIHYYDKDISMKCINEGFVNYVLNIPFVHMVAATRREVDGERKERESAGMRFVDKWKDVLPADVTGWREKLSYLLGFGR